MLADTDVTKRRKAISVIQKLRRGEIFGNDKPREFRVPPINFDAEDYDELVDWDHPDVTEPILTAEIGIFNVERMEHERFFVGKFISHTQSTERAVKLVTEAGAKVVGQNRRDGNIKATITSRRQHPKSNSKKDLVGLVAYVDSESED